MARNRFVALLRGINVGGKNVIARDDLARCFEDLGFERVRTYIQSGNVLFRSGSRSVAKLTAAIEAGLADRFSYDARAVILSRDQYASAVDAAPAWWGRDASWKHNALFTLAGVAPEDVLAGLPAPEADLETVATAPGVLFWSASTAQVSRTTMMKLGRSRLYRQLTVRNHNTVLKLRELIDEPPAGRA
ncbi:MAG: DUF1697 domain-containing protein [Planctomycetota bacterium]